jgi:hypothetical protein
LFDLDVDNDLLLGEAGRNFVVATVFPSREVCLLFCFSCCLNAESSELIMFSAVCLLGSQEWHQALLGSCLCFGEPFSMSTVVYLPLVYISGPKA